jgi:hypothetical protein
MAVAMPVSDANRKVNLIYNSTECDRHAAAHPVAKVWMVT